MENNLDNIEIKYTTERYGDRAPLGRKETGNHSPDRLASSARTVHNVVAHARPCYSPVVPTQRRGLRLTPRSPLDPLPPPSSRLCYDTLRAQVRIDEARTAGDQAWVYSTGEISGRLRWPGTWTPILSWQHEREVAQREQGVWRLYGYQQ